MPRPIMAKKGDSVRIKGSSLTGKIRNIRYDDNNREIYTIELDRPNNYTTAQWPTGYPFWYARHEELEWL